MGLDPASWAMLGAAGLSTAGTVAGSLIAKNKSQKTPQLDTINKEVMPNTDAALRNAQDMARRRKGVAANILTDGSGTTAGSVATKTLLGQ